VSLSEDICSLRVSDEQGQAVIRVTLKRAGHTRSIGRFAVFFWDFG
jgi:hypothetical protein